MAGDARERAVERLAAVLDGVQQTDRASALGQYNPSELASAHGYEHAFELADAVLREFGLVAIDSALVEAVERAEDLASAARRGHGTGYQLSGVGITIAETEDHLEGRARKNALLARIGDIRSAKIALADAVLAQLRGQR